MAKPGPKSAFETIEGLEKIDRLIEYLRQGHSVETCCNRAGITKKTFYKWHEEARAGKSEAHINFSRRVDESVADFEMGLINSIVATGKAGTWQALAWVLERRRPETWSRQDHLKVTQQVDGQVDNIMKEAEKFMDPADFARLVNHLSKSDDEREEFVNIKEKDIEESENVQLQVDSDTMDKIKDFA